MDYLLTPAEETRLELEPKQIQAAAEKKWPNASFDTATDPESFYLIKWEILERDTRLEAALHTTRNGFSFSGSPGLIAEAAIWARRQVPETYSLILYDQGYSFDIQITQDTSPDQLIDAMSG